MSLNEPLLNKLEFLIQDENEQEKTINKRIKWAKE